MPGAVDLHTHTTASDGTYSPAELVEEAARRGLRFLAITDHDSTEGLPEAMAVAESYRPLEILPGIEINCDVEGAEIHILGYFMDWQASWFQDFCREQRRERRARVHRIVERLAALNMPVDAEEVFALVKEGSAGRPHVAQVMVAHGYVKSVREAFDKYLGSGKPANVPRKKLTPADAVRLLRKAGGVPVFGIECYYTEHSAAQRATYVELCHDHGLVATGGSDFHGPKVRAATLGSPSVPLSTVEELRAKAAASRSSL